MTPPANTSRTPMRFFRFRWLYALLVAFLWYFFITLIFFEQRLEDSWSVSTAMLLFADQNGVPIPASQLHGFLGLYLKDYYALNLSSASGPIQPFQIAAFAVTLFLLLLIAAYAVPESGNTKNLPARRAIPLRGRLAVALMVGLIGTGLASGVFDVVNYEPEADLRDIGLIDQTQPQPLTQPGMPYSSWRTYSLHSMPPYAPVSGFATRATLVSLAAGIVFFGIVGYLMISFVPLGRDRYWQAERWTLLFTFAGLAMIVSGAIGMDDDLEMYVGMLAFLGGCYTTLIVGLMTLVWAWTCRTTMLMMLRRYETATYDPENPACFACGYNLRGLSSQKCPECGAAVNERMQAVIRSTPESETHAESRSMTR